MLLRKNKILLRSFLAFSNVGRGLLASAFGMVLNYILIQLDSKEVLNSYVYFISIFGLLFNVTNWGGKFFNTKEISKYPKKSKKLISSLISSKVILVFIAGLGVIFIPLEQKLKILLLVLLFLKSLTAIFDSLILFQKKSKIVLAVETILSATFLLFIFINGNSINPETFLFCFTGLELMKFLYYLVTFWKDISFRFSFTESFIVLKTSFYFFCVSAAGFFTSKSDLYIVGLLINKETMSYYFIISSLSGVAMVVYATLINTFATSIYRFSKKMFRKLESFLKFFGLLFSIVSTIGFYIAMEFIYKIPVDLKFALLFFANIFLFTLLNFEMYRFTKLEKQQVILLFLVISAIVNCAVSFLVIKELLLFGALLANTIGILSNYLLFRFYITKKLSHEI